ncbi:glycosyltransferase family 2 protein [Flavobacterium sp. MDT1-60]|nr:glycosyltransferase family A protein [Flavobacterium sp. MDT1-60]QOG04125.1 glycosyltransferase family 2 protein [Flavobacterium sp. MDT1-60]
MEETVISIINVLKDKDYFELLIIDNNSTDCTPTLKQKYGHNKKIKYFLELQQGLSHARNRGLKEAKGEILVYLDDDIELVEDYFEVCDQIFSDESILISGGKVIPYKVDIPKWLPEKYYFLVSVYDLGDHPKFVKYLMGGNFAIRSEIALEIGLYNVELGRNGKILAGGEEIDYQNRATAMGYKMYYHPNQNILHKINEKLNENYVLNYSKELGKSERIIDEAGSGCRVLLKILKCYSAEMLFNLFIRLIREEKKKNYLKIIKKYSEGYLIKL